MTSDLGSALKLENRYRTDLLRLGLLIALFWLLGAIGIAANHWGDPGLGRLLLSSVAILGVITLVVLAFPLLLWRMAKARDRNEQSR